MFMFTSMVPVPSDSTFWVEVVAVVQPQEMRAIVTSSGTA